MSDCTHCGGNGKTTENIGYGQTVDYPCTYCGGKSGRYGWGFNNNSSGYSPDKNGSGKAGACFPATTKISTKLGDFMISDIEINNEVLSVGKDGLISYKKVIEKVSHQASKIWCIYLSSGSLIRTTATHSFKSNGTWKKASQLASGDLLVNSQGNEITVLKSYKSKDIEPVYNLIVEDNFTFIAEDTLVHSFTYFRTIRSFYWSIKKVFRKNRSDNIVPT